MKPFNGKFWQSRKNAEVKDSEQNIIIVDEKAANEDIKQKNTETEPVVLPELSKGSKGEIVMKAQRILKSTSDYIGYIDGDFGWVMEAAVQSFQRRSKVAITGVINNETWEALNQIRR
ncbi:MAG: peptidoglycan-binding domain-containing protein [Cyanobacteria bacterium J06621_15]